MNQPPLVVVLGATGFVGRAVCRAFAGRAVRLRMIARSAPERAIRLPGTEFRLGDLTCPRVLAETVEDADVVVHLAADLAGRSSWRGVSAESGADLGTGIVDGMAALFAGRRPPVVLFAGSVAASTPSTSYERHKLAAERALAHACADGALRGTALRLPTVYGPGTDRGLVATMARRALDGVPLTVWGTGTMRRDLVFVDDVARAFVAAADASRLLDAPYWEVGTGTGTTVAVLCAEVAAAVAARTGMPPVPVHFVAPPAWAVPADLRDCVVESTAFRAATGWRPRTGLRSGVEATLDSLAGTHQSFESAR